VAPNDTERSSAEVGLRLTYAEIAARLGISGDAARQLVRRRGWRRIVPNRLGAPTTVIVPEDELHRRDTRPADVGETTPDSDRPELHTALTLVDRLSVRSHRQDRHRPGLRGALGVEKVSAFVGSAGLGTVSTGLLSLDPLLQRGQLLLCARAAAAERRRWRRLPDRPRR
jgi:hypothetical protein